MQKERERGLCLKAVSCGWHEVCSIAMAAVTRADWGHSEYGCLPCRQRAFRVGCTRVKESCGRAEYL